jgi:hypothetical protein
LYGCARVATAFGAESPVKMKDLQPAERIGESKDALSKFLKDADRKFTKGALLTLLIFCIGAFLVACIKRHTVVDPPGAVTKPIAPFRPRMPEPRASVFQRHQDIRDKHSDPLNC